MRWGETRWVREWLCGPPLGTARGLPADVMVCRTAVGGDRTACIREAARSAGTAGGSGGRRCMRWVPRGSSVEPSELGVEGTGLSRPCLRRSVYGWLVMGYQGYDGNATVARDTWAEESTGYSMTASIEGLESHVGKSNWPQLDARFGQSNVEPAPCFTSVQVHSLVVAGGPALTRQRGSLVGCSEPCRRVRFSQRRVGKMLCRRYITC